MYCLTGLTRTGGSEEEIEMMTQLGKRHNYERRQRKKGENMGKEMVKGRG
jgi:hypothetical protein